MIRISIQSEGPAKLLLFNSAATSFGDFISIAGIKLGLDFDGSKDVINVYLSQGGERTLVEKVEEIRDGDLIVFEKVSRHGYMGVKDEHKRGVVSVDGHAKEDDEVDDEEVEEVKVERPSPTVIDLCDDSDSDSGSDSDSDNALAEDGPLPYSWMEKDDAELLTSDDDDEDDNVDDEGDFDVDFSSGGSSSSSSEESDEDDEVEFVEAKAVPSRPLSQSPARKKRSVTTRPKSNAVKKPLIYGYIDPADLPMAPGTLDSSQGEEAGPLPTASSSSCSATTPEPSDASLVNIKARIAKMLQLGLHASTSEAEAQHAMRLAQKLLQKFNLTQAAVMLSLNTQEEKDSALQDVEALQGGLVTMQIRRVVRSPGLGIGTDPSSGLYYAPATSSSWIIWLAGTVALNFQVKTYYVGPTAKYTFYGLKTNAQLAGYAFKIAVEKIVIMKDLFVPPPGEYEDMRRRGQTACASKGGYTLACRNSYCEGIVSGITKFVKQSQKEEDKRRAEKLAQARARAAAGAKKRGRRHGSNAGEAGSGDDDDDDHDDYDDEDCEDNRETDESGKLTIDSVCNKRKRVDGAEDDEEGGNEAPLTLDQLEDQEKVSQALTLHTEDVADRILKSKDIKVKSVKRAGRVEVNSGAWAQGMNDSKNINLNERAITE